MQAPKSIFSDFCFLAALAAKSRCLNYTPPCNAFNLPTRKSLSITRLRGKEKIFWPGQSKTAIRRQSRRAMPARVQSAAKRENRKGNVGGPYRNEWVQMHKRYNSQSTMSHQADHTMAGRPAAPKRHRATVTRLPTSRRQLTPQRCAELSTADPSRPTDGRGNS